MVVSCTHVVALYGIVRPGGSASVRLKKWRISAGFPTDALLTHSPDQNHGVRRPPWQQRHQVRNLNSSRSIVYQRIETMISRGVTGQPLPSLSILSCLTRMAVPSLSSASFNGDSHVSQTAKILF
jgi:hypothetical protein